MSHRGTAPNEKLRIFSEAVSEIFDRDDPAATLWRLDAAFKSLMTDVFTAEYLDEQVRQICSNPYAEGDWHINQLIVLRIPSLALGILGLNQAVSIASLPYYAMYIPLSTPIRVDVYAFPDNYKNEVFDPTIKLIKVRTEEIPVGHTLHTKDTEKFIYDLVLDRPTLVAKLSTSSFQGMRWTFNRSTLKAVGTEISESRWASLRSAANVLGRLADPTSSRALQKLAEHPHFLVRWAAIQNLSSVDPSMAIEKVLEATRDHHPAIQQAAKRTSATIAATVREPQ